MKLLDRMLILRASEAPWLRPCFDESIADEFAKRRIGIFWRSRSYLVINNKRLVYFEKYIVPVLTRFKIEICV